MTINTSNFGELDFTPESVITVEAGLLGFEEEREFLLVNNSDTEGKVPFWWLQSCNNKDLAFVVTVPFLFDPDYQVDIPEDIVRVLGINTESEVVVYSICKIPAQFDDLTVNLKSPVIVNAANRRAMQIVLHGSDYRTDEPAVKKYKKYFGKL